MIEDLNCNGSGPRSSDGSARWCQPEEATSLLVTTILSDIDDIGEREWKWSVSTSKSSRGLQKSMIGCEQFFRASSTKMTDLGLAERVIEYIQDNLNRDSPAPSATPLAIRNRAAAGEAGTRAALAEASSTLTILSGCGSILLHCEGRPQNTVSSASSSNYWP